jgi:hypothetical protein
MGGPLPRTIEDEELLLDEDRLRHDGTHAAGTQEAGERCDEMNEKNDQIARW